MEDILDFRYLFYLVVIFFAITLISMVSTFISKYNAVDLDSYIYEVTSDEILAEYKENNILAEVKYKDNIIKINGTIDSITGNADKVEIVLVDTVLRYRVLMVFTDTKEIQQIASLSAGDSITVVGKVGNFDQGLLTNILTIKRCNYQEST
jgi:hypothetical protein